MTAYFERFFLRVSDVTNATIARQFRSFVGEVSIMVRCSSVAGHAPLIFPTEYKIIRQKVSAYGYPAGWLFQRLGCPREAGGGGTCLTYILVIERVHFTNFVANKGFFIERIRFISLFIDGSVYHCAMCTIFDIFQWSRVIISTRGKFILNNVYVVFFSPFSEVKWSLSEVKWSKLWLKLGKASWHYIFHDCYCLVYSMFIFIDATLYNGSCDCCVLD
jgi:hypothetical protein